MNDVLLVGVVQTSLNHLAAWQDDKSGNWENSIRISAIEERRAKKEIRHYLSSLNGLDRKPNIVLLPELSVPLGYETTLRQTANNLEAIVIAGLDYRVESSVPPEVSNEAIVIVPRQLGGKKVYSKTLTKRVGKTYPAPAEEEKLKSVTGGPIGFHQKPTVWIFDSNDFGKFAVAVCYDFMDLDRLVMYRNQIQTLFVLAYNRDISSFDHMAEAIARTVFCNVVICNCGFYGGSFAVSPYREPYKRTVYRHSGQKLPNAQLIELPLGTLEAYQHGSPDTQKKFKSLPPGFNSLIELQDFKQQV